MSNDQPGTPTIRVVHVSPEIEFLDVDGRVVWRGRATDDQKRPVMIQLNEVDFPPGLVEILLAKCGITAKQGG